MSIPRNLNQGIVSMCGIVGLYLKKPSLYPNLGQLFKPMLVEMTSRGPDSAGVAIYRDLVDSGETKFSLAHDDESFDWHALSQQLATTLGASSCIEQHSTHAIMVSTADEQQARR